MSTTPYPWPPKEAQPDVSKPGRSTAYGLLAAPVYRSTLAAPSHDPISGLSLREPFRPASVAPRCEKQEVFYAHVCTRYSRSGSLCLSRVSFLASC